MMFQSYRLLPWKTVAANVAFALPDLPRAQREDRVSEVLHLVGLERFADRYPAALSGECGNGGPPLRAPRRDRISC